MSTQPSRHFVTLAGRWGPRQVHYRRAGSGPAVLLLHQSPQSSREFEALMRSWAGDFTLIAPDTPGYGLSDPLPVESAAMEDFAAATVEFADALGLRRFGIYGYHTGGGMAVALADGWPERVTTIAVNGLVMPTDSELATILANYLPRFAPRWDGSHLTWLWARLREQTIFFPWHERHLANRMDFPVPPPEALQRNLREFLHAGDHYRLAYAAAFSYRAAGPLQRLRVPALITAARLDPLAAHLQRIGERAAGVEVSGAADADDALARARAQLAGWPGEPPPAPPNARPLPGRIWQDSLPLPGGSQRLRRSGERIACLLVHAAGASAATLDELLLALGDAAALDLPGHGENAGDGSDGTLRAAAEHCLAVAAALPADGLLLGGVGSGAWVAVEAARCDPRPFRALLLQDPPMPDAALADAIRAEGLPSLAPDWHGGHLSRAWHMCRDARLFHPWFRRDRASIRWTEPQLDEARLTLEVREKLSADGCWQALARAALDYPWAEALADLDLPILACAQASSPWHSAASRLLEQSDRCRFLSLPDSPADWPELLRPAAGGL
ncbi:MAG: alpha/beta fold hydrolase [Gammaproteobacteria bacterium]|nr:MAG: alpha/beta fold hydrolase [Gammaproteobacteria bacterium]